LSDSRDFTDFTQFTTNRKPSIPTGLPERREKKRDEFEGEKKNERTLKKK
jgi:hypothetical protein